MNNDNNISMNNDNNVSMNNDKINNLERINLDLSQKINQLTSDNHSKVDKINQLITEKQLLTNKNDNFINNKTHELHQHKNMINDFIINNNTYLQNSKTVLINSIESDNNNSFNYKLEEELHDVSKIELLSYDIPYTKFNINNGYIKYEIGDAMKYDDKYDNINLSEQNTIDLDNTTINIESNNYSINNLILYLNKFTESTYLYFEYINSKIIIKGINFKEKKCYKIKLLDSNILNKLKINKTNSFENQIESEKILNIRYDNYVLISFKNITDKDNILCIHNQTNGSIISLDNLININNIEIDIKTLNKEPYNCNGEDTFIELKFYFKNKNIKLLE
tara:strand:- start:1339 stop:2346 length:1008 start_codon:yes stop_codon:yes gene_type:complete